MKSCSNPVQSLRTIHFSDALKYQVPGVETQIVQSAVSHLTLVSSPVDWLCGAHSSDDDWLEDWNYQLYCSHALPLPPAQAPVCHRATREIALFSYLVSSLIININKHRFNARIFLFLFLSVCIAMSCLSELKLRLFSFLATCPCHYLTIIILVDDSTLIKLYSRC